MDDGDVREVEDARLILFLISPQIFDFDTYLPIAMGLKKAQPNWHIRFVTFSKRNHDFIMNNPTHRSGMDKVGVFSYMGWEHASTRISGLLYRIKALLVIGGWILRYRAPVLFLQRPFVRQPYTLWHLLARLRGGAGYVLWKSRSPDVVHHRVRQVRKVAPPGDKPSMLSRFMRRNCDAFIHFHDFQAENIEWSSGFGRIDHVPWIKIGMPHYLMPWRDHIREEVEQERRKLFAAGIPEDAEFYCMFPAKPHSHETLREIGSVEETFGRALKALCRIRPKAFVLCRPHPRVLNEPYFRDLIEEVGQDRAQISFAHPEVLLAMSRRAIFNNPSNLLFTCYQGRFVDVSDYPDQHFEDFGEVSLAHGYGAIFVNPRGDDFTTQFTAAIEDDRMFEDDWVTERRDAVLTQNRADLSPLLNLLMSRQMPQLLAAERAADEGV
jgi:hypothetical protein